jgi:hypothetical protein
MLIHLAQRPAHDLHLRLLPPQPMIFTPQNPALPHLLLIQRTLRQENQSMTPMRSTTSLVKRTFLNFP